MNMCEVHYDNSSPLTDEEAYTQTGLMLASAHPKKRAGRKKFKETRHPVYRGIRQRNSGKWVSEVRQPNKNTRIWLGTYPTAEMAARAHDVAAMALRGRHACLNFADSPWRLNVPASSETKDIQKAAAEAAEAFRPAQMQAGTSIAAHQQQAEEKSLSSSPLLNYYGEGDHDNVVGYMDEDMVFGMPSLLTDMYHGLGLMPPPQNSWVGYDGDLELESDVSLWSYSI